MHRFTYGKIQVAYDIFCSVMFLLPYFHFDVAHFPCFPVCLCLFRCSFLLLGSAEGMILGGADLLGLPLFLLGGTWPFAIFSSFAFLSCVALARTAAPLCNTRWFDTSCFGAKHFITFTACEHG